MIIPSLELTGRADSHRQGPRLRGRGLQLSSIVSRGE
jgi:hypothetical protein